nr:unnamed protein product [Callosobruchus chinensis]
MDLFSRHNQCFYLLQRSEVPERVSLQSRRNSGVKDNQEKMNSAPLYGSRDNGHHDDIEDDVPIKKSCKKILNSKSDIWNKWLCHCEACLLMQQKSSRQRLRGVTSLHSWWIKEDWNILCIQEMLGHSRTGETLHPTKMRMKTLCLTRQFSTRNVGIFKNWGDVTSYQNSNMNALSFDSAMDYKVM